MKPHVPTQRQPATGQHSMNQPDHVGTYNSDKGNRYSMIQETITSLLATLVLGVVVSGLYPLVVSGIGQVFLSHKANGSLIVAADGKTVLGSELLGQNFSGRQYFNPRPSAAGAAGYDPTASGGTNLGPTSDKLINGQHKKGATGNAINDPSNFDGIKDLVAAYRTTNGLSETDAVPADAVTRSGSGLDPHISVANALLQLPRVTRERNKSQEAVRQLVNKYTEGHDLGFLGQPGVNTVRLNLALDGKLPVND